MDEHKNQVKDKDGKWIPEDKHDKKPEGEKQVEKAPTEHPQSK